MTISEAIQIIDRQISTVETEKFYKLSNESIQHLKSAKSGLEIVKDASLKKGDLNIPESLSKLIKTEVFKDETTSEIYREILSWRKDIGESGSKRKLISIDIWLPIIVSVIVLIVGLSLGFTVFKKDQDMLYFVLESIKDIIGSIVSGFVVKEVVNHKSGKSNNTAIVILGTIFGLFAFAFSIVLWVGSDMSIIERFTHWGKLTYLWVCLTTIFIAIVCAVSIVFYLLTYKSKEVDGGAE